MSSTYPTSGPFATVLDTYLSSYTSTQKQTLWNTFVADTADASLSNQVLVNGQLVANPENSANLGNFQSYVQGVAETPYPTTGAYGSILQSFLGSFNAVQKQQTWDSFLSNQGLTANPTDDSQSGAFLNYIEGTASWLSASTTLSPNEVQKRALMVTTFNSVLAMLDTLQNTVAVQAKNLVFFSQLQQQYTLMLTGGPVYSPNENNSWDYNTTDPTKFTFGYDNISVANISSYLAEQQQAGTLSSSSFQLNTAPMTYTGSSSLTVVDSTGTAQTIASGSQLNLNLTMGLVNNVPTLSVSVINSSNSPPQVITLSNTAVTQPTSAQIASDGTLTAYQNAWSAALMSSLTSANLVAPTSPLPVSALQDSVVQSGGTPPTGYTLSNFYTPENSLGSGPVTTNSVTFGTFSIPWRATTPFPTTTDSSGNVNTQEQQADTDATTQQGQYNAVMQQYVTNTRAQEQTVQNMGATQQQNMNTTQQSVSNQANILTSMLQTIQGVMNSVFQ